jgi:hypothetical protein
METYYKTNKLFFHNPSSILVYAVDPGAWAMLSKVASFLISKGLNVRYLFEGWAKTNASKSISLQNICTMEELPFLEEHGKTLIIYGAQQNFKKNYAFVSLCRKHEYKTMFVFDSWKNYLINFVNYEDNCLYLPDKIAVADSLMKNCIKDSLSGHAPENYIEEIGIIGHLPLIDSVNYIKALTQKYKTALQEKYNPDKKQLILFIMEPIRMDFIETNNINPGYDEYTIFTRFLNKYCSCNDKVLVKAHPRQNIDDISVFISKLHSTLCEVEIVKDDKIENLIAIADKVYGMTSIALNVSIESGKEVHSIQHGRNSYGESLSNPWLEAVLER